jgi:gliding motility-associated-like protein
MVCPNLSSFQQKRYIFELPPILYPTMKRSLLFLLLLCATYINPVHAQKQNNIWPFGPSQGLDFNSGSPVKITTGANPAPWGCVSLCDPRGKLLFYSNGGRVWDRTHTRMPNGDTLTGYYYSGSAVYSGANAIAQLGDDTNRYYLFVMGYKGSPTTLSYSLIDMTLNGGLGDVMVSQKTIPLDEGVHYNIAVIKGENCISWVVAIKDTSTFLAYKVDAGGVHKPVSSELGASYGVASYGYNQEMKVSPDRKTIAMMGYHGLSLYDFDAETGKISRQVQADRTIDGYYGLEFSPDGTKLYTVSVYYMGSELVQYNLALLPDTARVRTERISLVTYPDAGARLRGMRRGPDGKIYIAAGDSIACIEYPNNLGSSCGFNPKKFTASGLWGLGLNMPSRSDTFFMSRHDTAVCTGTTVRINAPANYTEYLWSDGSTGSSNTFTHDDTKWVKAHSVCGNRIDTFRVNYVATTDSTEHTTNSAVCFALPYVYNAPTGYDTYSWSDGDTSRSRAFTGPLTLSVTGRRECFVHKEILVLTPLADDTTYTTSDTLICFAAAATLEALPGYKYHLWQDGSTTPDHFFNGNGSQWVLATNKDCKGTRVDTMHVAVLDVPGKLPADKALCPGVELLLSPGYPDSVRLLWQDGSHDREFRTNTPGTYWVNATAGACTRTDTARVYAWEGKAQLGPDTNLCAGKFLMLYARSSANQFAWSDGSRQSTMQVTASGIYWVTTTDSACSATDSIEVNFLPCEHCITMPNAFTPNGDGRNDVFLPAQLCPVRQFTMRIYNRWGEEVFNTWNAAAGWHGDHKGTDAPTEVYYYMIRVLYDYYGAKEELVKGNVTLIR